MNKRHYIILIVIVLIGGYSIQTLTDSLNPYVSISQAKATTKTVQVKGKLLKDEGTIRYDQQKLHFTLTDDSGDQLPVIYSGDVPENFTHATDVIAVGHSTQNVFQAEKLLIKCPSKYQKEGAEK